MTPYYDEDGITIYHGDCREVLGSLAFDVIVTDPPYGISHTRAKENHAAIVGESTRTQSADRVITRDDVALRDEVLEAVGNVPKMVFGSWRAPRPHRTMGRLIWDRVIPGVGFWGAWKPLDEEIYLVDWPNPRTEQGNESNIIRSPRITAERPDHPTPKPVNLMRYLITNCPPGVIADPFMGSGTTLRAAKDLGRRAIGIEIEERYCEIAAKRLAQGVLDFGGAA